MRNAATFTEEPGFSSLHGASPVSLHPMKNGPAGTATISAGRGSAAFVVADACGSGPGGTAAVGAYSGSEWLRPTTTSTATPTRPKSITATVTRSAVRHQDGSRVGDSGGSARRCWALP